MALPAWSWPYGLTLVFVLFFTMALASDVIAKTSALTRAEDKEDTAALKGFAGFMVFVSVVGLVGIAGVGIFRYHKAKGGGAPAY